MNEVQIDVNDIVNGLLEQIAAQSREIAILKAQITALTKSPEGEEANGSDTV